MRIGILLTGFDGGGAQRRLLTLAHEFLARGHAVDLVAGTRHGPFRAAAPEAANVVPLDGPLHAWPALARRKSLRMLAALPALVHYLRQAPPDVLLGSSPPANLAALVASGLAGARVPVVVSVNVPLSRSTATRARPGLGWLVRRLYPRAAGAIAISRPLADDTVRFAGVPAGRVATVPNPVAADEIRRAAAEPADERLLGDPSLPLLLSVGKLKAQKDLPTLLRAFRRVRDARPARLLVLGSGDKQGELVRLSDSLGLAGDVVFAGFVANPFPYLARAAVFVSSSRWEGFSNVVAEALAIGCPVVATDCPGGVGELLGGGRFGRLVAVGDADAMARAILDTLDHPPDRDALRARADGYSVSRAADGYLEMLLRCAGPRPSAVAPRVHAERGVQA